ncbi:helix-turn-helix transcriptional regulator [Actinopolymorpha sp. B9G3]|uniref:helix-turn-helix domain-containing protein n=1 Tax=Actinopolymorpha sp. B9G3 TaxID=3158970 RepID=UPI0032D93AED
MVRPPLGPIDRQRGLALGTALRAARGQRSMVEVAALAGVSVETVRKIERGRVPTPAFFTVVALAEAVGLSLADLCQNVADGTQTAAAPHDTRAAS